MNHSFLFSYLVWYNSQRNKVNKVKKEVEVASAIIYNNDKIFCCQRPNKGECALKWEFPGGKIETNETCEEALHRELKEELACTVVIDSFVKTISYEYETFKLTMHTYKCHLTSPITLKEHVDAKWTTIDEMLKMDFALADFELLTYLKEGNI